MRGVSRKAIVTAALVLVATTAWADVDPPEARAQPPVGYVAEARIQPPGGFTSNSRLQPPGGEPAPESRLQPPVGEPEADHAGFVDLLACWLRALLSAAD